MTISANYGYVPTIHKQSDIPGRTSRICYADNDSVPPEKRGKKKSLTKIIKNFRNKNSAP